eukprot:TRINITY_DN10274_c0_g2_i2.p1 TRINITY_DN10274_c0_g2~~TRINITY_DN10274_c0_g2_i2.p1  ORF type:complete len:100 (-),score=2.06 TRINITY_DN10274_c0_g2_i2:133-432(-)
MLGSLCHRLRRSLALQQHIRLIENDGYSRAWRSQRALLSNMTTVTNALVVYVTVPNAEVADQISASLVGEHLAACVNAVPGDEPGGHAALETQNSSLSC